jgi:sulfur relay (sulfurtransferase) DsrF/TusC family protein
MMKDILILIRRGPYGSFQADEGLRHANGAISLGFRPILFLIDDGVYLAKTDQNPGQSHWLPLGNILEEIIARGLYEKNDAPAEFYVEKESLAVRGLDSENLVEDLLQEAVRFCQQRGECSNTVVLEDLIAKTLDVNLLTVDAELRGIDVTNTASAIAGGTYESLVDLMVSCDQIVGIL